MAEINLGELRDGHKALVNEHDKTKGRLASIEGTVEVFAGYIVTADETFQSISDELNGVVDTTTGEITVAGIKPRLDVLDERMAKVEEKLEEKKAAGIPDWFMNTNPELAAVWLEEVGVYTDRVLRYFIKEWTKLKLTPCWPWHPRVVDELLISAYHYRFVHRGGVPMPAADMRRQWLDGTRDRVNDLLGGCALIHKGEYVDSTTEQISHDWTVDQAQLPAYLTWWCTSDREGIPPGLRRKT